MSEISTLLSKIQELNDKQLNLIIPSKSKEGEFLPLSFKQQKDVISTISDNSTGPLKFQKHLNDIIISNSKKYDDVLITDKYPIIIQLRSNAISDKVEIDSKEISLSSFISKIKYLPKEHLSKTINTDDLIIELHVPTITQENKVLASLIENIKKDADEIDLGKNITLVYTYEILKHIKSISFGEQVLIFDDINIKDRFNIVENLPLSINKEIVEFVQGIKKIENEFLTVEIDGKYYVLDMDVGFFEP